MVLVLCGWAATPSAGQEERPQIVPQRNRPQENRKPKNGKEPRAVAVVQFSGSSKGTLIPVAILIDGKFYDASAYKADPVPMALESGTVYEAEQTGDPDGLFVVNGALHSQSAGSAHPWVGTGTYLPPGTSAPKDSRKAEDVPVGMGGSSDDEPPRLTRKGEPKTAGTSDSKASDSKAPDSKSPDSKSPAGSPAGQETPKTPNPPSGDKPADASGKPPAPSGSGQASPSQPPPSQTSPAQSSAAQASTASSKGQSSSDDADGSYYRPQLRRGKPTTSAPPDEDDKAVAAKGSSSAESAAGSKMGSPPVRMVAAISDAAGPDPQSYKFFWKTGEEDERRNQMLALAAAEVRAYAAAMAKNQIPARPVTSKAATGGRKVSKKPLQPVFENIQFNGFNLWLTDQPIMILSAEAHIPVAPGASAPAAEPYSIMLVARTDIYGDLRKLYSGVTDRFHLDVTPRLELIDVVDADGDGRGELLFRETADTGSGYLIYRATADKLWKMFDSLNAE